MRDICPKCGSKELFSLEGGEYIFCYAEGCNWITTITAWSEWCELSDLKENFPEEFS